MSAQGLLTHKRRVGAAAGHKEWKERVECCNRELNESFRCGCPVAELLKKRAQFIDALLVDRWQVFLGEFAARLALVAVGGYGRGELSLYSDIENAGHGDALKQKNRDKL